MSDRRLITHTLKHTDMRTHTHTHILIALTCSYIVSWVSCQSDTAGRKFHPPVTSTNLETLSTASVRKAAIKTDETIERKERDPIKNNQRG